MGITLYSAAIDAAGGDTVAREGNGKYDGWSVVSNRPTRPISLTSGTSARSCRMPVYFPFAPSMISIGVENADTGNAPSVQNTNSLNWRAAVEVLNVAVASASGSNVNSVATATKYPALFGGRDRINVAPSCFAFSDPVKVGIQAGTVSMINTTVQPPLSAAPSAPTVATAAGTNINTGTYYVGYTLVYADGSESPCSAATSVTLTSNNQQIAITAPAAATYPAAVAWRPYIGLVSGSSAGPLYCSAPEQPMGTNLTVSLLPNTGGGVSTIKQATPGGTVYIPTGGYLGGGTASGSCDDGSAIAIPRDMTMEGFGATASVSTTGCGYFAVLAKDPSGKIWPSVAVLDDSIAAGTGDTFMSVNIGGSIQRAIANQVAQRTYLPTIAPLCGHLQIAVPGQTVAQLVGHLGRVAIQKAMLCTHIYSNGGTNDIATAGVYATALLANKLTEAVIFTGAGKKFRAGTLLPRTASTDGWQTVTNQSMPNGSIATTFAGSRQQYNNVLRSTATTTSAISGEAMFRNDATQTPSTDFTSGGNGTSVSFVTAYPFQVGTETIQVNGVTKVLTTDYTYLGQTTINGVSYACGVSFGSAPSNGLSVTASYTRCAGFVALVAAAEVLAGLTATGNTAVVDVAATIEANGAGAATVGGHWWQTAAGANVGSGTVGAGATTSTITGSGWTQDQYRGYMFIDTTTGYIGTITGNTTTVITTTTLGGTPGASDTYVISRVLTLDGSHPSPDGYMLGAVPWFAQLQSDVA